MIKVRKTKRTLKCSMCGGSRRIIKKYFLFTCAKCFRESVHELGWCAGR